MKKFLDLIGSLLMLIVVFNCNYVFANSKQKTGLISIDTGVTITKVRVAKNKTKQYIIASGYDGELLGVSFTGKVLWKNALSGFMNHDIWAGDVNNDGVDELFAANANGTLYCLNSKGELLWEFKKNDAPMYAVCTVNNNQNTPYIACGGYDTNLYYLNAKGELIKTIPSTNYALDKAHSKRKDKILPKFKSHVTNFLRPAKHPNYGDILVVHGVNNSMSGNGSVFLFSSLSDKPFKSVKIKKKGPFGDVRIVDANNDGYSEVLMGRTGARAKGVTFCKVDTKDMSQKLYNTLDTKNRFLSRGMYRVIQAETVKEGKDLMYLALVGSNIVLSDVQNDNMKSAEVLTTRFSFNDMVKNPYKNQIILASAQSGGSAIHILNLDSKSWKKEYTTLNPPGKIQAILHNTEVIKKDFKKFKKPAYQKESATVYFMSEKRKIPAAKEAIERIERKYENPIFLNGGNFNKEVWDRSSMGSEVYKTKRDRRMKYNQTQNQIVNILKKRYDGYKGISFWGGHGNDPFMFQPSTMVKGLEQSKGKKTVIIYPELEDHSKEFQYVIDNLFMPIANKAKTTNGNLYLRNKHLFWQSSVYLPKWKFLVSGEYANTFVPAMEETTDKSMELSLASRMGLWTSGAVNSWGARCARDNASFDRLRQHSNQTLPNHFLRTMVYTLASGAQYIDNFPVDQSYMSLLWDLTAKGALFIPKRSDILSFSPVHLGMIEPDEEHLNEASNVKWLTFYNKEKTKEPFVFSRLNGTWPGAPLTDWDFSKYAAGNHERRLNFIPKYNKGMVLITPPQKGVFTDKDAIRKPLEENMHPYYKGKMKEYISNGRDYISADGKTKYKADEYYKVVKKDIEESASLLPITVEGNVGWVVAQIAPKVLRLTIVENGYINPKKATATVIFNTIKPKNIIDILSKEEFTVSKNKEVKIEIPLGGFRFIDVELSKVLPSK